jgi:hypothetical protein
VDAFVASLIDLYSTRRLDDVDSSDIERATGKRYSELEQDSRDVEVYNCIRDRKGFIERIDSNAPAHQQRTACLIELRRLKEDPAARQDAGEICDAFISKTLMPAWQPPTERDKYRLAADILLYWNDYFLSYTRRGHELINQEYARWFSRLYGSMPARSQQKGRNLVAKLVHDQLKRHGLRGYFDETSTRDGANISEDVQKHLDRSFALVQFIHQEALLVPPGGAKNWPFEEFLRFTKQTHPISGELRLRFVIAGEDLDKVLPVGVNSTYKSKWLDVIRKIKYATLTPTPPKDRAHEFLSALLGAPAETILQLKQEILDQVMS